MAGAAATTVAQLDVVFLGNAAEHVDRLRKHLAEIGGRLAGRAGAGEVEQLPDDGRHAVGFRLDGRGARRRFRSGVNLPDAIRLARPETTFSGVPS